VINSAWGKVPEDVQEVMGGPLKRVVHNAILQYHIVPNATITSNDIFTNGAESFETLSGFTVLISNQNGIMSVNDVPTNSSDLLATNGVVHLIDTVLLPSQQALVSLPDNQ
jgi:uncharacterized surface protein with fasciclin (FAS1) repeats